MHTMTLEEQIGQVLAVGFHGTTPTAEIIDLIQNHHVGNIIFFARNIQDTQQVRELTQSLQKIAREAEHRYPLLITIDQENGMVRRFGNSATIFPGNMALGAIGSEQMAYDIALSTGRELQALGINMNLAPVVDVNNNPANPVIGVRSFGEDPQQVARLGSAMVKGYQAAGIITNLKHFPGHGDTAVDSHLALPSVPYTMERLEEIELVPFKSGIAAGAESIMIAHMYLPALVQGEMLPSTVSPRIVTKLLREQLGFEGMIISDCMEMKALADTVGTEQGAVMALRAGIDLVLVSHTYQRQLGSIQAIREAVQDGTLSPETLHQAAERVLSLKERKLSWNEQPDAAAFACIGSEAHQQLRDHAYSLSTTLVRNTDGLVPLRLQAEQRILLLYPQPTRHNQAQDVYHPADALLESIQQRHARVEMLAVPPQATLDQDALIEHATREADIIIVATTNANLDQRQAELVQKLLQTGKPVIGIAVYNPYDLLAFPQLATYLVTYEYTQPALAAATRVLFGEIQAQGHLPVSLPGLYTLTAN